MNPLDFLIIGVIAASAIAGVRRGFILGAFEFLMTVAGLGLAALLYGEFAALLGRLLPFSDAVLNILSLILIYALIQVPAYLLLKPLVGWSKGLTGIVPGVHPLDRAGGLLPGFVQGVVVAYVIALSLGLFSTSSAAGSQLAESRLGIRLFREGTAASLQLADRAGFEFSDFYAVTPRASHGTHLLPFTIPPSQLEVDDAAEARMLALVNQERQMRGLQPLQADPRLAAVARAHAVEMFSEGYFAHESPRTGSPFDRLAAAGIGFAAAGENLAFAPDVERAHEGLMNSEGHRENILNPAFGRVGIGAMAAPDQGTIYVQVFTD